MLENLQSKLKPVKEEANRRVEAVVVRANELREDLEGRARRATDGAMRAVAEAGLDVRDAGAHLLATAGRDTLGAVSERIGTRTDLAPLQPRVATLQAGLDRLVARLEAAPIAGYDAMSAKDAIAAVAKRAKEMPKDAVILANLCGRGDKDIFTVAERLGVEM